MTDHLNSLAPKTVRDLLHDAVDRANTIERDCGIGGVYATVAIEGAPSTLLRLKKSHLTHRASGEPISFKDTLLSSTALTPPDKLYLPHHIGETMMQANNADVSLVEKQPGQSLLHRVEHHNAEAGRHPHDQRGKLAMLQEFLKLRGMEGRSPPQFTRLL